MTHILHVVEAFGAGVLSMLVDVANQQARDGYRVSLVYTIRPETPKDWQTLFDSSIQCYLIPMTRAIHPLRDLSAAWQLWRYLHKLKPQIVHLHSSKAGALGRLVSIFYRRARYFFSPHGLSFLPHAGRFSKQRVFLWLEKILAYFPGTIIACSSSEAEEIRRHVTPRVCVVENAVDSLPISVKTQVNSRLRIGSVGRICAQKHPEALAEIARACQTLPVDFVWLGAGDKEKEKMLRTAGVTLLGWRSRAEVLSTLSRWDIYLQTSRWEGMPVAVIEAMLAGLPVIVSDVIGNRDVVLPGETGFIAPDTATFLQTIQLLLAEPDKILTVGQRARKVALNRFSLPHMMHTLYQVYGLA